MSDYANNTAKYPRPPFVDQPQSPPGLAEEMKPQPDHGELSYSVPVGSLVNAP
ncbi:Oxidoreductase [Klebsiella grimontii]|uniref:Oxidoreductase n=1 Tax=Klebsiella grimontii TaxID=2058152 RepID=A0A7H4P2H6_9ENTR|nr:Oxidoreductase [Klebsiella grimontii]